MSKGITYAGDIKQKVVEDMRMNKLSYRSYKGQAGLVAENLLERNFEATRPNQKWVTDITEFSLFGEKLYLSAILDLYSRDIVSYAISERPLLVMVMEMLEKAIVQIPDGASLILHSDQGWHYQHKAYQRLLDAKGIRQSMSRKGTCLDNAVIENFFGILKSELLYLQDFNR
jgi:putative transposase